MSEAQCTPGTDSLNWFKSSYSGSEGGACLEVAFDWHKSSYSAGDEAACVEVATCPEARVHVRDSKNPAGPSLTLSPATWTSFTAYAIGE